MAKKGATGDFFFSFLQTIFFSPKMDNIFMEKKTIGRPPGFNFSHLLYRKQNLFIDSLRFAGLVTIVMYWSHQFWQVDTGISFPLVFPDTGVNFFSFFFFFLTKKKKKKRDTGVNVCVHSGNSNCLLTTGTLITMCFFSFQGSGYRS